MRMTAALFCALVASVAGGAEYTWKTAVDGLWQDSVKWTATGGTTYPGGADTAKFCTGVYTISSDADISLYILTCASGSAPTPKRPVLDLCGHTLTGTYTNNWAFTIAGSVSQNLNLIPADSSVEFRNGTFNIPLFYMGYAGGTSSGGMIIGTGAVLTANISYWNSATRVIVKDGGVWNVTGNITMQQHSSLADYGFLCVTGLNSRISMVGKDLSIRGNYSGLYALDGGRIDVRHVKIGDYVNSSSGTADSDDTFVDVRNGIVALSGNLTMGWNFETNCYPRLSFRGGDALLAVTNAGAGTVTVYNGLGATLEFDLADGAFTNAAGNVRAPFRMRTLTLANRVNASWKNWGETKVRVKGFQWMYDHPDSTLPLIELETANAAALEQLAATLEYPGFPGVMFTNTPALAVSPDGRTLSLITPGVHVEPTPPTFTAAAAPAATEGDMAFTVNVEYYGAFSDHATSVDLLYGTAPDYSDAVAVRLADRIDLPVPVSTNVSVSGFLQDTLYYAKMIMANEQGLAATNELTFTSGGFAEVFNWKTAADGIWQNVASWTSTNATFTEQATWPRGEDTIKSFRPGTYTVTFNADAQVRIVTYDSFSSGLLTLDLNGHTLDVTQTGDGDTQALFISGWKTQKFDFEYPAGTVEVRGGTLNMPHAGILLANAGADAQAGLVLNGTVFNGDLSYWDNGSRMWVKGGSVWTPLRRDISMMNHSAGSGFAFLCVTGANSRVAAASKTLTVRGNCSGLYVMDGGTVESGALRVGGSSFAYFGSPASSNTFVDIRDGTVDARGNVDFGWADNTNCAPHLILTGTQALFKNTVTAGSIFNLYENLGARIDFNVPTNGYADTNGLPRAPLQVNKFAFKARTAGYTDWGGTRIRIAAKAWMKANPKAVIPLVKLTTADEAALLTLKGYVEFTDVSVSGYPNYTPVVLSEDYTELRLVAPPRSGLTISLR